MTPVWTGIKALVAVAFLAGVAFVTLNLFRGTWMVTPVLSGSMRPGFSVGGVVISERTPLKDITVRDVIVFENPYKRTEQMIHRIIKLTREPGGAIKIKTQGDDNNTPDPWTVLIKTREVYQIKASVPLVGYVAVAYQNYRGIFITVAGLLLLSVAGGTWLEFAKHRGDRGDPEDADTTEAEVEEPLGAQEPALVGARVGADEAEGAPAEAPFHPRFSQNGAGAQDEATEDVPAPELEDAATTEEVVVEEPLDVTPTGAGVPDLDGVDDEAEPEPSGSALEPADSGTVRR